MELVYAANRRFGPGSGESWPRYVAWSGLHQLRELITLDTILCPPLPVELTAEDWRHNVHADFQTHYFRSVDYLLARVGAASDVNVLAIRRNPTAAQLDEPLPPDFAFAGFDLLDVAGDVSALTNCGGFPDVFASSELSEVGLLPDLARAYAVRQALRSAYPTDSHTDCHVWAIWRLERLAVEGRRP
jgi:hypothetical protein